MGKHISVAAPSTAIMTRHYASSNHREHWMPTAYTVLRGIAESARITRPKSAYDVACAIARLLCSTLAFTGSAPEALPSVASSASAIVKAFVNVDVEGIVMPHARMPTALDAAKTSADIRPSRKCRNNPTNVKIRQKYCESDNDQTMSCVKSGNDSTGCVRSCFKKLGET